MLTAVRMAWAAAGQPAHPKAAGPAAGCVVCGTGHHRTLRAKDALGANFDILTATRPDLSTVCEPCAWALAGKPPLTLRMWSILTTESTPLPPSDVKAPYPSDGRLHLCNRRDQSAIITALTSPPPSMWACSVAVSGQKHLLPYTPVNTPSADTILVRFEACTVETTPGEIAALIGAVASLRVAGHGPGSIHAVTPAVPALTRDGLTAWRRHSPTIAPHANSPLLGLALHLTTKETINGLAARFA
jgi:hypothetical protein